MKSIKIYIRKFFKIIGPGFITGASDDDPSGIATCSQAGAKFGYHQLWTIFFMLPLMIAIQEAVARIGAEKGRGLAYVIKKNYNKPILYSVLFLLLIANVINISADLSAMAEVTVLIFPVNFMACMLFYSLVILLSQIFIGYKQYSRILKFLCLSLIAYPVTLIVINAPLLEIIKSTFFPHIEFTYSFLFLITGLLGTSISPYMFFWQASQEKEEVQRKHLIRNDHKTRIKKRHITSIRFDTVLGMLFSQITSWSIIVVSGTVLHTNNITDIKNSAQVAEMLEPLVHNFSHAGLLAKVIFSVGLIGLGMIAIPVLAGSLAYAICDTFDLPQGLNRKFKSAKWFYSFIICALFLGFLINFTGLNPISMLIYSAVLNGVIAVPLIFMVAIIARNKNIMGRFSSGIISNLFVWIAFISMFVSAIAMFFTLGRS